MYICPEHGDQGSDWCDECQEILKCDCSKLETTRFKDLIYDSESGDRTVTIHLKHCSTCGDPVSVSF